MPISEPSRDRGAGRWRRRPAPALCAAAAILFGLSACTEITAGSASGPGAARSAQMAGGDVILYGPEGYCVDHRSLRRSGPRMFALFAQCDLIESGEITGVTSLSILTATVVRRSGDATVPGPRDIAASFAPAPVLTTTTSQQVSLVQLGSGGDALVKGADPRHWRGAFSLNGYIVGLAAYSSPGGAATGREGRGLLLSMARNSRASSPGGTADAETLARLQPRSAETLATRGPKSGPTDH
ncbi:hypothetical protein ACRARG_09860 [Pseudooceanicola sp. C21-150M6]|uniref:hypothetical protein n=1 Tax=Pseudooceanicola sp. C21-150M6 TaxID=3434355 RepID=UPI003D7F861F